MVWLKFIICVAIIFLSGRKIAKYGDIIASRSGLGGVWIGLILIAMITSLPELFTGISAITLVDAPDLTVGDLLGANAFNLLNLALLDMVRQNGSLLASVSPTHRLTGWLSLGLVLVVAVSIFLSHHFSHGNRLDRLVYSCHRTFLSCLGEGAFPIRTEAAFSSNGRAKL